MVNSIYWHTKKPKDPGIGDFYMDKSTYQGYIYTGSDWVAFLEPSMLIKPSDLAPTKEELEKHPTLKSSWEEYLVVRRLIGI